MLMNELSDTDLELVTGGGEKDCRLVGKEVTKDKNGKVIKTVEIYDCRPPANDTKEAPIIP